MTTATTVAAIRRILKDEPDRIRLDAAVSDTTTETATVETGQVAQLSRGMRIEHDDGSGEQRYVLNVDEANDQFDAMRGYNGSTAATHLTQTWLLLAPRFPYDQVTQAINHVLDITLPGEDIYDIQEETITSSSTTNFYNAASASCEEHLAIYQFPTGALEPIWLKNYSVTSENVNTTHFAQGKTFRISDQFGTAGTDPYYVSCRHPLTITTLTTAQNRIVEYLSVAMLMEQENPKRTGGRTPMGDRAVRSGEFVQSANWYRSQAERLINMERSRLRKQTATKRRFVRVH